jgi:apolipoprotein D and lipocalin family protein
MGVFIADSHYMKTSVLMLSLLLSLQVMAASAVLGVSDSIPAEVKVVDTVDLNRYIGKWYEIASIPVWFQKSCDSGSTAEYSLTAKGEIIVVNRCCTKEGTVKEANGRAWIVEKSCPAKLKVGFFSVLGFFPFKGDYWIIDLDPDYRYVVIGHPTRTLGWILSRTPALPPETLKGIADRLTHNGYNFSDFKMTNQTEVPCSR